MGISVLTPAATSRLTIIENVWNDLGIPPETALDSKLDRFMDQASERAASFCHRTFGRQIYRERFNAWDLGLELVLDASPINRIVSVHLGGQLLDPSEYEFDDCRLYSVHGGHRCAWNGRGLDVVYEAGWVLPGEGVSTVFTGTTPLPADIEKAVIQLVAVAVSESGRDMTVKSDSVEGIGNRSYYVQGASAALPHPAAEATLMQYRKLVLV